MSLQKAFDTLAQVMEEAAGRRETSMASTMAAMTASNTAVGMAIENLAQVSAMMAEHQTATVRAVAAWADRLGPGL